MLTGRGSRRPVRASVERVEHINYYFIQRVRNKNSIVLSLTRQLICFSTLKRIRKVFFYLQN